MLPYELWNTSLKDELKEPPVMIEIRIGPPVKVAAQKYYGPKP